MPRDTATNYRRAPPPRLLAILLGLMVCCAQAGRPWLPRDRAVDRLLAKDALSDRVYEYFHALDVLKRDAHVENSTLQNLNRQELCDFFSLDFEDYFVYSVVNITVPDASNPDPCTFLVGAAVGIYKDWSEHTPMAMRIELNADLTRATVRANLQERGRSTPLDPDFNIIPGLSFTDWQGKSVQRWKLNENTGMWQVVSLRETNDVIMSCVVADANVPANCTYQVYSSNYPLASSFREFYASL